MLAEVDEYKSNLRLRKATYVCSAVAENVYLKLPSCYEE